MPGQQLFDWVYRLGLAGAMWDRDIPDDSLTAWVDPLAPGRHGRALDLGCGTGTHSLYLARCGYRVDAVDFSGPALGRAAARARAAGCDIRFLCADVLRYQADQPYDLVIDYGCFHSLEPHDRDAYARRVEALTAPGGQFILMAFSPRWSVDWRLMGPYHVPVASVRRCFAGFEMLEQREAPHYWEHVPVPLRSLPGPYRARVYHMQRRG
jgi:cyclopropane fatty-acyl-phospholipid synthase-like methyltransferase